MRKEDLELITELRHRLHAEPELSGREEGTVRILQDFLAAHTSLEIVDRGSWFYAVKQGTPGGLSAEAGAAAVPIAFRADMDALPMEEGTSMESTALPYASHHPGVSHKCGHDGHMAALCGLALALDQKTPDRTVYLIFQPAEEIGQGALLCRELICEKGIGEIYAFHNLSGFPEGSIVCRRGLTQPASEGLIIRLQGMQSHASEPKKGRNPAAALAKLALYAQEMAGQYGQHGQNVPGQNKPASQPLNEMALCTIVGLRCGTGDFGISAGEGEIRFTLRAERESVMKEMEEALLGYAAQLAEAETLNVSHEIRDYFPETRNDDAALARVLATAAQLELPAVEMPQLWRASEDFGYYLKECPGAMFYIGNGEDWPPVHTADYDFNDRILTVAVDMFAGLAYSTTT